MTWFVIGALFGSVVGTVCLGRATRGRSLQPFDWLGLGVAVCAGAIFFGGMLMTASRLLST